MKITFVSNYINHHQIPLSNALYGMLEGEYCFVQTEPMEEERLKMGWQSVADEIPYVKKYYENPVECAKLIDESDVVIFGGTDDESYIKERLNKDKFTIRYFERIYKTGQWRMISPRGLVKKYNDHIRYRKKEVYLLCAGGYVADDFHLIGAYPKKMMKWGYFPENKRYEIDSLLTQKQKKGKPLLLWTGRMLGWKHPEYAVLLANELKKNGYVFSLHMVGNGEQKEKIVAMVNDFGLQNEVTLFDFMTPKEVREKMEEADVYLITSDRMEGWGAVVNEAMNSGCAVVASHMIGATPYLIKHEKNGLVFKSGDIKSLTNEVTKVLTDLSFRMKLGKSAYETIDTKWNAREAAKRLLEFVNTKEMPGYSDGPCSVAKPVREYKMYKLLTKTK